jgi:hypothetical protein
MRRLLALALLVSAIVVVHPGPASACSCDSYDTTEALAKADGAFIGRLVSRRENPARPPTTDGSHAGWYQAFLYRFRVDQAVKGSFPSEVVLPSGEGGGDAEHGAGDTLVALVAVVVAGMAAAVYWFSRPGGGTT